MATKIVTKNSSTAGSAPLASDLVQGELAVNVTDKRLYTENASGVIVEVGTNPSAEIIANGGIALPDNGKATFGAGDDLQIYHNATSNIIDSSAATLAIQAPQFVVQDAGGTKNMIWVPQGGSGYEVQLAHDGTTKLATTSTGIDVTGTATVDGLTSSGTFLFDAVAINKINSNGFLYYDIPTGYTHTFTEAGNTKKLLNLTSGGDISFYEDTGTTPKFFWDASAEALEVGTSTDKVSIYEGAFRLRKDNANKIFIGNTAAALGSGTGLITYMYDAEPILWTHGSTERMRIDASGNVGIGTSSPTANLSVGSTTTATGDVTLRTTKTTFSITPSNTDAGGVELGVGWVAGGQGPMKFNVGGERMRIDSSGNLLVGKTASSYTTDGFEALAAGAIQVSDTSTNPVGVNRNGTDGSLISFFKSGASVGSIGTNSSYTYIAGNNSGAGNGSGLNFGISIEPTNRLGGVHNGITDLGSSSNRFKDLYLSGGVIANGSVSAMQAVGYGSSSTAVLQIGVQNDTAVDNGATYLHRLSTNGNNGNHYLIFDRLRRNAASAETMRIDGYGNLMIGTTSEGGAAGFRVARDVTNTSVGVARFDSTAASDQSSTVASFCKTSNDSTTNQTFIRFGIDSFNSGCGQINANGSGAAAFGSFSDMRLKENITKLPNQLSKITALRPVEFDYIESEGGGHQIGFIAQEVESIYPDLVGEREDGMKTLTGIGKMEARLVKAIQEQQTLIESLTARISALEE